MKKTLLLSIVFGSLTFGFYNYSSSAHGNSTGAPAGRTGSPGDGMSCANGCHTGSNNPTNTPGIITSNIPGSGYVPGTTYTITAGASAATVIAPSKYGFEISPQNAAGALQGTLIITNAAETQLVGGGKYVTHTQAGTAAPTPPASKTWTFNWTAPSAGSGAVTFYGAFVLANGNGNSTGDQVLLSTLVVQEATTGINESAYSNLSSLNTYPNPVYNKLFIEANNVNSDNTNISIVDITGRKVQEIKNIDVTQTQMVDLSHLSNGVYVVTLETSGGIISKKIIKK